MDDFGKDEMDLPMIFGTLRIYSAIYLAGLDDKLGQFQRLGQSDVFVFFFFAFR